MKDPIKLKDLLVEQLDLAEVLKEYGADFIYDPERADEAQYRCPIHGSDNKPSARLYRSTKSCFCWVCRKSWDVVSLVQDKENLRFVPAVKYLIDKYKIDTSSVEDAPDLEKKVEAIKPDEDKSDIIQIKSNLLEFKGTLPLEKYRALCYAYSMILFASSRGSDVLESVNKLKDKIRVIQRTYDA